MADIIKQEHDLDNVNYGGDQAVDGQMPRRPREPWDAAEYGITLTEAQRRYDAAQTPETRAKVVQQLKVMAQQRAGLDQSNGKISVAVAGKLPWHGLGVSVRDAMSSAEALDLANLSWEVQKQRLTYLFGGKSVESDSYALVRSDTGRQLGSCKDLYKPIQNEEAFSFMDDVLAQFGAKYETAGAIRGGEKVWMLANMPEQSFAAQQGDQVQAYALFQLDHTGAGATYVYPTSVRVVCANTFRVASRGQGKGIRMDHKGNLSAKIAAAQRALGLSVTSMAEFQEAAALMVRRQLDPVKFFGALMDELTDFPSGQTVDSMLAQLVGLSKEAMEVAEQLLKSRKAKRDELYGAIMRCYESSRCSPRGTAWAAFNAVTDHFDHGGKQKTQDSKFESCLEGRSDDSKQLAFRLVMDMAA